MTSVLSLSHREQGLPAILSGALLLLCGLIVAAIVSLPDMKPPDLGLDPSWQYAMEFAYRKGLTFGRDFNFTSGPLSFIYTQQFGADTFGWIVLTYAWSIAVYLAAIWWSGARWTACLSLLLMAIAAVPLYRDVQFFSLSLIVFLIALNGRAPRLVVALLAAGLALPCLAKFNIFVITLPLLGLADLTAIVRRTRFYAVTPIWLVALFALYVVSGQPISAFGEYLISSLDVANGYGQTMGNYWWGKSQTAIVVASFVIAACAFAVTLSDRERLPKVAALVGLTWFLFLVFKSGNVRAGHFFITWGALTSGVGLFFMLPASLRVRRWTPVISGVLIFACWFGSQVLNANDVGQMSRVRLMVLNAQLEAAAVWRSPIAHFKDLVSNRKSREQQIALSAPPNLTGTVGVVPWDFSEVIAAGYDFVTQPSLQQYSSYTPRIRRLDRDYFASERRPENLFFGLATIDGRYRTVEIGPSLPHILAGYDFLGSGAALPASPLLLGRRKTPRTIETASLGDIPGSMDNWISLPSVADGYPALSITFTERLQGKLLALLYKQSSFDLDLKFANGVETTARIYPNLVSDGFMVLPPDMSEITLFNETQADTPQVARNPLAAIRIHPRDLADKGFATQFIVSLSSVTIKGPTERPVLRTDPMTSLVTGKILKTAGIRLMGPGTLLAHSPSTIAVKLTSGKRLNGQFGVFDGAWQQGDPAPVTFKITATRNGGRNTLFECTLDPKTQSSDRGPHEFAIDLPAQTEPDAAVDLEFETGPGSSWGWSYWSKLNYAQTPSN